MKKIVAAFVIVLAIGLLGGINAATEQLRVDHSLIGYSRSAGKVNVSYILHVVNPGTSSFSDLSLHMVPLPPLVPKGVVVKVGQLGPHERKDASLHLVAPAVLDPEQFSRNGLFWTGKYVDADGKMAEFPFQSKPVATD